MGSRPSPDSSISAVLADRAAETPDAPFVYFGDQTVTYGELETRVNRAARALRRLGLGPGDRIGIASANSPDWIVAYLASCRIGTALVTLNVAYREREFVYMLNQSGARVLICDEVAAGFEFRPFLERICSRLPNLETVLFRGSTEAADSWSRFEAAGSGDSENVDDPHEDEATVTAESPAVILYTSGTTGDPKGATLTHRSLLASAWAQTLRLEQSPDDVVLGVMPFNHVGGLTCTIGASLLSGGAVALLPQFHPDLAAEAIEQRAVTIAVGVPTMYRMLLNSDSFATCDLATIRVCVVGGSNLEPELAEEVRDRVGDVRLANLYGLSETSGACAISPAEDSFEQITSSIGTLLDGVEGRIVDDAGEALPTGEVGELQVRGAVVAAGYWDAPEATDAAFGADGWLATGDVGIMSTDGHISLMARKKEMYVRGGYNVYPAEVENVLSADPSIAMSAVIGVPDAKYGETGMAFVVPAPGSSIDEQHLLELCRRSLAEYKIPSRIEVVDSLPMTPAGKIRKVALQPGQ